METRMDTMYARARTYKQQTSHQSSIKAGYYNLFRNCERFVLQLLARPATYSMLASHCLIAAFEHSLLTRPEKGTRYHTVTE
jgi:hypothetical protein